jgi:hypothetical protein
MTAMRMVAHRRYVVGMDVYVDGGVARVGTCGADRDFKWTVTAAYAR